MPRNYRSKKLSYKQKRSRKVSRKKGGSKINSLRSDNHKGGSRKQRGGFVRGGTNILNITSQKGGYNKSKRKLRRKFKINRKVGGCGCSMNKTF
tara:strand:- start:3054 stop:3335 length:282 start_codon:yes stop_codon:yes gene_type:complete